MRYGVEPVRNATVNAQVVAFVKRLPHSEAPSVAIFYLTHNKRFYVEQKHPFGLLLKDAEGLRTEWATGNRVTETQARLADRAQHTGDVFGKLIQEAEHGQ